MLGSVSGSTLTVGTAMDKLIVLLEIQQIHDPVAQRIIVAYSKYSTQGGRF